MVLIESWIEFLSMFMFGKRGESNGIDKLRSSVLSNSI